VAVDRAVSKEHQVAASENDEEQNSERSPGNLAAQIQEYLGQDRVVPPQNWLVAISRRAPETVVRAVRDGATLGQHVFARRKLRALVGVGSRRLHLGCGFNHLDAWINVDRLGAKADVFWDLRYPLPVPDGTFDAIFHEHVLEHLSLTDGFALTVECRRVLRPGGVLRVVVPDAGSAVTGYCKDDASSAAQWPTRMLSLQELFYGYGHVSMFDAETLVAFLGAAGFSDVEQRKFGDSLIEPCPDADGRRHESLYVEALK
jgi:SAM-dependent methyltransferase